MPTEKEMIEQLSMGKISFPPLSFRFLQEKPIGTRNGRFDAWIEARWRNRMAKFAVECKSLSTPKVFQDGLNLLKSLSLPRGSRKLLFVPFLSDEQLLDLEREGISGIDLCGNGVVTAPGKFAVFRSGGKNRFRSSAPIKNIYRKNSSMVARVFLRRPEYGTVQEILAEINNRNRLMRQWSKTPMSLATVSKSLKTLAEDLIVERNGSIRLLQGDKLLEKLSENYTTPKISRRLRLKIPEKCKPVWEFIAKQSSVSGPPIVAAGMSSVGLYALMQREEILSVYCPSLERLLDRLQGEPSDRFPNLELVETEDETVYFDARQEGSFYWASPVQTYLELMAGDKRDRETAVQVKSFIMDRLDSKK